MVLVGFPLLALAFTHRSLLIAGVAVAGRLPALAVALPAGALADRVNRRGMMVAIEVLRCLVLGSFAVAVVVGADGLPAIYATVFLLGALTVAFDVTAAACLPTMVPPNQMVRANAQLLTVNLTAQELVGQAVGGVVFAVASVFPFALDACSFAASAGLLSTAIPDNPPATSGTTFLADLRFGLDWFLRTPLLRLLTGLIASLAFCQALVLGVLVLYATSELHLSKAEYGLFLGAAAIGNVIGAVGTRRLHARVGSGWCIVIAGLAAAGAYPVLAATSSPFVAAAALAVEAMAVMLGNVAARSLRQSLVPQELQGRVASTYQMLILSALPLGALVGGLLASSVGIRRTFVIAGCLQLVALGVAAPRFLAQVRRHRQQAEGPLAAVLALASKPRGRVA
jgi:MFS family permease